MQCHFTMTVETATFNWWYGLLQVGLQDHLLKIQPEFRGSLVTNVQQFLADTSVFYHDYDAVRDFDRPIDTLPLGPQWLSG